MKRKTGIFAGLSSDPGQPALHMIKDAGFETIASDHYDVQTVCKLKNECDKIGLELTFLHAPYYVTKPFYIHTNEFWRGDLTYIPLYEATISTIDAAAESGVGTMMMHVSGGWDAPPVTDIGTWTLFGFSGFFLFRLFVNGFLLLFHVGIDGVF